MIKRLKLPISCFVAATLTLSTLASYAIADHHEMSKPKSAMGMAKVPVNQAKSNQFWWPDQLDLSPLRDHDPRSNPLGDDFNYSKAFAALDFVEVKSDVEAVLTNSQDWWPADFGNYGPFFIRLS
ncbi:MAG: catalase-peroxidase, partial [Planctomycetaceae bacterium]